jgi:hypothetical protein
MRKLFISLVVFFSAFLSLGSALATDNYQSDKFPPNELILKAYNAEYAQDKYTLEQIVGKYQDGDGVYHVYGVFKGHGEKGFGSNPMLLYKLDTNIWLIKFHLKQPKILMK